MRRAAGDEASARDCIGAMNNAATSSSLFCVLVFLFFANEELRNRQQMDYVHSRYDLPKVNGNVSSGAEDLGAPPDIQLRSLGDSPGQDAL